MRHYIADIDAAVDTATASLPPPDASAWTVPGQDFSQPQSQAAPPANGWAPPPLTPAAAPAAPVAAFPAAANGQQPQPAANQGSWFEEMTAASTASNGASNGAANGGAADGAADGKAAPASAAPASAAKSEQAAAPYPGGDEIPF